MDSVSYLKIIELTVKGRDRCKLIIGVLNPIIFNVLEGFYEDTKEGKDILYLSCYPENNLFVQIYCGNKRLFIPYTEISYVYEARY